MSPRSASAEAATGAAVPMPASRLGRAFVAISVVEAITWTGLLAGMLLEHVLHVTEVGVSIFGPLHGIAFLIYGVIALASAIRFRWGVGLTVVALLAAVPPLTTIPMERWLRQRGRLGRAEEAGPA